MYETTPVEEPHRHSGVNRLAQAMHPRFPFIYQSLAMPVRVGVRAGRCTTWIYLSPLHGHTQTMGLEPLKRAIKQLS